VSGHLNLNKESAPVFREIPKILVIDDDLDTLNLLRIELQLAKYSVLTAASWDEVMDRLRLVYGEGGSIRAIILDLMIPERSGFDILLALRVILDPMPPVIVLSALSDIESAIKARELGAMRYLTKPTDRKALINAIKEAVSMQIQSKLQLKRQ
jgi:DNA-binding response OmpR family regulator